MQKVEIESRTLYAQTSLRHQQFCPVDEKQLFLYPTQIYTIHGEYESDRRYIDLLLTRRPSIDPTYQFAIELKYLRQADAAHLERVKAEGLAQMQADLRHDKLRTLPDLRAWLIIFVGSKAQVVMPVGI